MVESKTVDGMARSVVLEVTGISEPKQTARVNERKCFACANAEADHGTRAAHVERSLPALNAPQPLPRSSQAKADYFHKSTIWA
jgi:hypothetical protein